MRAAALSAAALAAVAVLTGCQPGYPAGPAGQVTDRSTAYDPATKTRTYQLTTTRTFPVHITDYDACPVGSRYPACTTPR